MIDEHFINKKLQDLFGSQDGKANFRLDRTNSQYEYRRISDNIIEQRPKYGYLPHRGYWVLERLTKVQGISRSLLPGVEFSYEPVYVFKRGDSDEPRIFGEDAVYAIVYMVLFKQETKIRRDFAAEELAFYEKQVDRALEFLTDENSVMTMQLRLGEAVQGPQKVFTGTNDQGH